MTSGQCSRSQVISKQKPGKTSLTPTGIDWRRQALGKTIGDPEKLEPPLGTCGGRKWCSCSAGSLSGPQKAKLSQGPTMMLEGCSQGDWSAQPHRAYAGRSVTAPSAPLCVPVTYTWWGWGGTPIWRVPLQEAAQGGRIYFNPSWWWRYRGQGSVAQIVTS